MVQEWIKKLWLDKRSRYLIAAGIVLIAGIFTEIWMSYLMKDQIRITDVFVQNHSSDMTSTLEVAGEYGTITLSQQQKEELVSSLADSIGLEVGKDLVVSKHNNVTEVSVDRQAKDADTCIKLISVDTMQEGEIVGTTNYLLLKMDLYDKIQSVLRYKKMAQAAFKEMGMEKPQATVSLTGIYKGQLSLNEKDQVADQMIQQLGGNVTYESRKNDMYTVYAYSGKLSDYIQVADSKVNIQVAMNYNELTDETVVYLASPILNGSY